MICLVVIFSAGCSNGFGVAEENELVISKVHQKECLLCGDKRPEIFDYYESKGSLIILCINTMNIGEIYHSDNEHIESSSDQPYFTVSIDENGEDECSWRIYNDPLRHICSIEVDYDKNSDLNVKKISQQFCQNCLDKIFGAAVNEKYEKDVNYQCCVLMDMKNNIIYPISNVTDYHIGDIEVYIEHMENKDKISLNH